MGVGLEFNDALRAFGHADQAKSSIPMDRILMPAAQHIDVLLSELGMGEAVDLSNALGQILGIEVFHQVSTMDLEAHWGVLQGEVKQGLTSVVNEPVVKDILDRFDADKQHPLSFFAACFGIGDAALGQLDEMGNDVCVDGSGVRQQHAIPCPARGRSVMTLQPLLEQREQFVVPFLGHQFLQDFRRNLDKAP